MTKRKPVLVSALPGGGGGGGERQISSGGDYQRIFLGLKFLIPGFFGVGSGSIFLGGLIVLRIFLGIQTI